MDSSIDRAASAAGPARRDALRWLAAGLLGLLGRGCRKPPPPPAPVELRLADLPPGGRVRVVHGGNPIEVRRTEGGVAARSLWCTHWGCEVRWSEKRQRYLCPCHEGVYGADGRVLSGPPPAPLADYPLTLDGDTVRVGGPA